MNTFQKGDDVRLRSGGPAMKVQEVSSNRRALCSWENTDGTVGFSESGFATFDFAMLVKIDPGA